MNPSTVKPRVLARLRTLCLELPEAAEREAWGDPTWRVRNKIFAMQKGNHAGGRPSLWLKAAEGAQDLLVKSNPRVFFVPPYVGSKGWVAIHLDGRVPWPLVAELVSESYKLIAPKRLAASV